VLTSNIDERGASFRRRLGLFALAGAAAVALAWPLRTGSQAGWIVSAALACTGLFNLFQARNRWCVARACGFQTKL